MIHKQIFGANIERHAIVAYCEAFSGLIKNKLTTTSDDYVTCKTCRTLIELQESVFNELWAELHPVS